MNTCPKCDGNGVCSSLSAIGWTDGSNSNEPRLIYCINSNVSACQSDLQMSL